MPARFRASYRGIGDMIRSEFMAAEMGRRAGRVYETATATAPRHTGQYSTRFSVSVTRRGGFRHDRAAGVVTNDDPAAYQIEVGTRDTPAHRTLLKALDAARD